jgi:hypothetical protein
MEDQVMATSIMRQRSLTREAAALRWAYATTHHWLTTVTIVTLFAISACGTQTPPIPSAGVSSVRQASSTNGAPTRQVGNCLDGTSSSASYYAPQIQAILADAVTAWASPPPTDPGAGVPAQLGLHFVLRSVTTTSYSTDGSSVDATIPPVRALPPQPSPSADQSFDADIHTWTLAQSSWKQTAVSANTQASQLAGQVRMYQVARNTWSAIYSCMSATARQLGPAQGAGTRLAVISDMQNNEPVVGFSLAGAAVLMVTICPANVSTSCPQRFAAARAYLIRHGASSVLTVSADAVTPQTFDDFWRA